MDRETLKKIRESLDKLDMTNATEEEKKKMELIKAAYDELLAQPEARDLIGAGDVMSEIQARVDEAGGCLGISVVIKKNSCETTLRSTDIKLEDGIIKIYI